MGNRLINRRTRQASGQVLGVEGLGHLIGGLPPTADQLAATLRQASAEVKFSVLWTLSELASHSDVAASIASLATDVLAESRHNRASAAWVASDLLARHSPPELGAQGLLATLRTARFPEARRLSAIGIWKLAARADASHRRTLFGALRHAAKRDKSARVRVTATLALRVLATAPDSVDLAATARSIPLTIPRRALPAFGQALPSRGPQRGDDRRALVRLVH